MARDSGPAPRKSEPILPRKALVGWALLAVVLYWGFHLVGTQIKESVRQAVESHTEPAPAKSDGQLVITTPSGRRIIIKQETPPPVAPKATTIPPRAATPQPGPSRPGR